MKVDNNKKELPEIIKTKSGKIYNRSDLEERDLSGYLYFKYLLDDGLDQRVIGGWQKNYATWINSVFDLNEKTILDFGCGFGANLWCLKKECKGNLNAYGIENSKYVVDNIGCFTCHAPITQEYLKGSLNYLRNHVFTCDIEKSDFPNEMFDFIHSMMVLEHIKTENVNILLDNLYRITKKDGIVFSVTTSIDDFHPTHQTVKRPQWWKNKAEKAGFKDITIQYMDKLYEKQKTCGHKFMDEFGCYNYILDNEKNNRKSWTIMLWQKK